MSKTINLKDNIKSAGIWTSTTNAGVGAGWIGGQTNDWRLASLYVNNAVVHACISMVASSVASINFNLFDFPIAKNKPVEPIQIDNHPQLDLFNISDELLHAHDIFRLTATYQMICGRAYIYMERDPVTGKIDKLKMLQPWWVEPYRNPDGTIQSYFYLQPVGGTDRKQKVSIPITDMIDIRFPAPSDPYGGGDSPLRSAWQIASLSNKFQQYQDTLFDNRARPDQAFIPGGDIGADEAIALEKKFNDKFRGSGNGKTLILQNKGQLIPLTYQPQDQANLQIDHELKINLCNALHIPIVLMDDNPNRAGIEGAIVQYQREAVKPIVHLIQSKLNRKLVSQYGTTLQIIFDQVVPEDADFMAQQKQIEDEKMLNAFKAGAVSVNEYRQTLGLPPIVGGDDVMVPTIATPELLPNDDDVKTEPQPEDTIDNNDDTKHIDTLIQLNEKVSTGCLSRQVAISLAAKILKQDEKSVSHLIGFKVEKQVTCDCGNCNDKSIKSSDENPFAPKIGCPVPEGELIHPIMEKLFKTLKDKIMDQVPMVARSLRKDESDDKDKLFTLVSLFKSDDESEPEQDNFVPIDDWDQTVDQHLQPVIEIYAKQGSNYLLHRVGANPDVWSVVPPKQVEATKQQTLKLAQSTMSTTMQSVKTATENQRKEIHDGVFAGDTVEELGKRVNQIFVGLDRDHATMIGQTEASRAVHNGLRIAAKESNLVKGFQFVTSSEACPICLPLAGKQIGLDGQFVHSDYDDSMLPIHPRCRCTVIEVLKDGSQID